MNGKDHELTFTDATDPLGTTKMKCTEKVLQGVIPNHNGNWWFGRNGWCPGSKIAPWVLDITQDLYPMDSGRENTIKYYALYDGKDPDPGWKDTAALWLSSNLVLYTQNSAAGA